MSPEPGEEDSSLSPDDAFAALGNETRMEILHSLGDAKKPLSFSELRDQVGMGDSGQFNYHLDQLIDHFIEKTDNGYRLRRAGARVIEAILSGAVTEAPRLERTQIDHPCPLCTGSVEVGYRQERVETYCPNCGGSRGSTSSTVADWTDASDDILGYLYLPPAGIRGRTPKEIFRVASIWSDGEARRAAKGVCPRCSAVLDHTVRVCEDHDSTGGRCDNCDQRFGVTVDSACTNCIFDIEVPTRSYLRTRTEVVGFKIDHGIDPFSIRGNLWDALNEEILSTDPFEARYTFSIDNETLSLTVDDQFEVIEVTRTGGTDST